MRRNCPCRCNAGTSSTTSRQHSSLVWGTSEFEFGCGNWCRVEGGEPLNRLVRGRGSAQCGFNIHETCNPALRPIPDWHTCGQGVFTQNSTTMLIGIGEAQSVKSVTVRWPSGVQQTAESVSPGTLLTVRENAEAGSAFSRTPYHNP
ncbi:MAG: ASPIC/UnbV domain-containing protein [Roseibacillus sp.]